MVVSPDGAVSIPGKAVTRIGDSIVATEDGFDYLTSYPKELGDLIVLCPKNKS